MAEFTEPTRELARRMLSEVEFEDRLVGYQLYPRLGEVEITLFSFEEIVAFLGDQNPYVDLKKLETWVREVIGDHELAEKINRLTGKNLSAFEKMAQAGSMMEARLKQCRRVAGMETTVVS
jgi:hypothetical protein